MMTGVQTKSQMYFTKLKMQFLALTIFCYPHTLHIAKACFGVHMKRLQYRNSTSFMKLHITALCFKQCPNLSFAVALTNIENLIIKPPVQ